MRKQPYLDDLEKIVPSRYSMVIGVAKRARQILEDEEENSTFPGVSKPVSIAMYELLDQKLRLIENPDDKKDHDLDHEVKG